MCGTFNVYFNDTQHLAEVLFQILFYLTPIIYRIDDLGRHRLAAILRWSPIVAFLDLIREPLMNHAVPTASAIRLCHRHRRRHGDLGGFPARACKRN